MEQLITFGPDNTIFLILGRHEEYTVPWLLQIQLSAAGPTLVVVLRMPCTDYCVALCDGPASLPLFKGHMTDEVCALPAAPGRSANKLKERGTAHAGRETRRGQCWE